MREPSKGWDGITWVRTGNRDTRGNQREREIIKRWLPSHLVTDDLGIRQQKSLRFFLGWGYGRKLDGGNTGVETALRPWASSTCPPSSCALTRRMGRRVPTATD